MKNMENFAAQQLTKKQMNDIKGGTVAVLCPVLNMRNEVINYVYAEGDTYDAACSAADAKLQAHSGAPGFLGQCERL